MIILSGSLIDTHCHLDFSVFDADRQTILQACRDNHIDRIIIPGVCRKDWQKILYLCSQKVSAQKTLLYPAVGLHPCFVEQHHLSDLHYLNQLCTELNVNNVVQDKALQNKALVAIGEIGLDFFSKKIDKKKQYYYFSEQLDIAVQHHLPVLIHARKSHNDVLNFLSKRPSIKGIIHAYSGSYEQAKEYLKQGFKLGFGGAFTYPQATKLRSLVAKLPLEAWVLETDAPDMSPVLHSGEKNSPQYLHEIAHEFAMLYDSRAERHDFAKIVTQLQLNSSEIFPFL